MTERPFFSVVFNFKFKPSTYNDKNGNNNWKVIGHEVDHWGKIRRSDQGEDLVLVLGSSPLMLLLARRKRN